ncbi:hypothetical protein ACLKA6_002307 [Drosophila palustris]
MSNLNKTPQMIEKEKEMESNHAFAKSSKLARSPPAQQPVSTATRACSTKASETQSSAAVLDLGREIANLVEMLDDGKRRSIHQPMRDSIESIRVLYELAAIQLHDDGAKAAIRTHQACQTSPLFRTTVETKRKQGTGVRTPQTKRVKNMSVVMPATSVVQLESPNGDQETPTATRGSEWRKVTSKRKPRKPKGALSTKVRPDALVIKTVGEVTYADLLRKVKQDEKLHGLGEAVSRIRRTQQGELLLQLNSSGEDTSAFKTLIGETLGETAEIRSLSHRVTIECKDLDEITTAKDIVDALRSQMGITDAAVDDINLRKGYGGTQTASIRLPAESARKALSAVLLKVGWVRCRLRERVNITKCYRCLEFGHLAKQCRSEVDRSKLCRRCGKDGHLAKDCKEEPQCMFCKGKGSDWKHIAGSAVREKSPNVVLICEPYKPIPGSGWVSSRCKKAAIWAVDTPPKEVNASSDGFVRAKLRGVTFYSCYAPPSWDLGRFERMLADITDDLRGRAPFIGGERQNQRRPNKSGPKWKDRFLDADTFSHVFNVAEWNPTGTSARQLSECLDAACDSSMPRRKPSRRGSPCYWWNDQIAQLRKACLRARRCSQRARRRPDFEDRLEDLRAAKRALKCAIKASKSSCFKQICEEADVNPWGTAHKDVTKTIRGQDSLRVTCPILLRSIVETLFPQHAEQDVSFASRPESWQPISVDEVKSATKRIGDRKAPGPDGIPNKALKLAVSTRPEYLGVLLDNRLSFRAHVDYVVQKASRMQGALSRMLPNIGGPKVGRRLPLARVVASILLYAAPIWAKAVESNKCLRRKLSAPYRLCALRVISGFRTVSHDAALVVAGMIPVDILAMEMREIYLARAEMGNGVPVDAIRRAERQASLVTWQVRWDSATNGRWTHQLIPKVEEWLNRGKGEVNFHLAQFLTGHGGFRKYLHKYRQEDSPECPTCPSASEDPEHVLY